MIAAKEKFRCKLRADLGFIIDGSVGTAETLKKEQNFVKGVVSAFGISKDGAHAGVVVGGSKAKVAVKMNEHMNSSGFEVAVSSIGLLGGQGQTRLDKALLLAYDELFTTGKGARDNVGQVLMLLTTKKQLDSVDGDSLRLAVSRFNEAGIKIIVVVVGKNPNKDILKTLAKDDKDVFYLEKFDEVTATSLQESIAKSACKASGMYFGQGRCACLLSFCMWSEFQSVEVILHCFECNVSA